MSYQAISSLDEKEEEWTLRGGGKGCLLARYVPNQNIIYSFHFAQELLYLFLFHHDPITSILSHPHSPFFFFLYHPHLLRFPPAFKHICRHTQFKDIAATQWRFINYFWKKGGKVFPITVFCEGLPQATQQGVRLMATRAHRPFFSFFVFSSSSSFIFFLLQLLRLRLFLSFTLSRTSNTDIIFFFPYCFSCTTIYNQPF